MESGLVGEPAKLSPFGPVHEEGAKMERNVLKRRVLAGAAASVALTGAFLWGRATAEEAKPGPAVFSLPSILAKNAPGKDEPYKIIPLASGKDASATEVVTEKELKPHYHEGREEWAYVIRGGGTMLLGDRKRPVKAGDLVYIPRGTVHGFANGAKGQTVVLSIMAPPFDGKDRHFIEEK
jgi:mannose-6-phosphate isomerase-like protein (cupin superfamily)